MKQDIQARPRSSGKRDREDTLGCLDDSAFDKSSRLRIPSSLVHIHFLCLNQGLDDVQTSYADGSLYPNWPSLLKLHFSRQTELG
jgi:hypothetical protein